MGFSEKRWTREELEEKFDQIHMEYERKVFSLAWRLTGDEDAARDIGQKTFLTLHMKMRKVLKHPTIEGWLAKTVHYFVKHYRREQAYRARHEAPLEVAEQLPSQQPVNEVQEFLDILPKWVKEKDREMLVLYYCHRYSLREIGNSLGLTYSAVRARMARLHSKLRESGFGKSEQ